ncbi:TPA: hypothetical protein I1891_001932 [Staphylococcus pseudintermedius]|nr:hypothetical protein [Staphylococcus pseudintermedius]
MTKVNLKKFNQDREGNFVDTNESVAIEIEAIRPRQFAALTKILNETQKDLQSNKDFQKTVGNLIENLTEGFDFEDIFRSEEFNVFDILNALGFLIEEVPQRTTEILSVTSGISQDYLELQDMDTYFEIAEAVIEVNDIKKIVKRVQSLSRKLGKALAFMKPKTPEEQMKNTNK